MAKKPSIEWQSKIPEVLKNVNFTETQINRHILEDLNKEAYERAPAISNEMRNARQVTYTEDGGYITYPKIYSARLYFGEDFNFTLTTNPNAGPLWGLRAIEANKEKWHKYASSRMKGGLR